MPRTCPLCQGTEFRGEQACQGTVSVIVTLEQSGPAFLRNDTANGDLDVASLNFGNPQGPFKCVSCGTVVSDTE
jgi:hypothetical protein